MDRSARPGLTKTSLTAAIAGVGLCFAIPSAAQSLSGTYDTPLGKISVVEKSGVVSGSAVGKNPCGFKAGKKVLEGTRLDDSVTGTIHTCKVGEGCSGEIEGIVMLLVTQNGKLMSGAVHLDSGKCSSPVGGDGITLKRSGGKTSPKPSVAAAKQPRQKQPKQSKTAGSTSTKSAPGGRKGAEKLALEGQALFESGAIEEARARFLQSVEVDPSYSQGYVGVGVTYYMRDRYDEALDYYKKGLEANPGNRDAYYNMACVYALKGESEQALRYLRIAVLNGYVETDTIGTDPDLKSLHENPDFKRLSAGEL